MIKSSNATFTEDTHFDFLDWEKAFQYYDEVVAEYGQDAVQFVVSEHPHTSGYWIESAGCETSVGDQIVPSEQVKDFEERVRIEIDLAKKKDRLPKFIRP